MCDCRVEGAPAATTNSYFYKVNALQALATGLANCMVALENLASTAKELVLALSTDVAPRSVRVSSGS